MKAGHGGAGRARLLGSRDLRLGGVSGAPPGVCLLAARQPRGSHAADHLLLRGERKGYTGALQVRFCGCGWSGCGGRGGGTRVRLCVDAGGQGPASTGPWAARDSTWQDTSTGPWAARDSTWQDLAEVRHAPAQSSALGTKSPPPPHHHHHQIKLACTTSLKWKTWPLARVPAGKSGHAGVASTST